MKASKASTDKNTFTFKCKPKSSENIVTFEASIANCENFPELEKLIITNLEMQTGSRILSIEVADSRKFKEKFVPKINSLKTSTRIINVDFSILDEKDKSKSSSGVAGENKVQEKIDNIYLLIRIQTRGKTYDVFDDGNKLFQKSSFELIVSENDVEFLVEKEGSIKGPLIVVKLFFASLIDELRVNNDSSMISQNKSSSSVSVSKLSGSKLMNDKNESGITFGNPEKNNFLLKLREFFNQLRLKMSTRNGTKMYVIVLNQEECLITEKLLGKLVTKLWRIDFYDESDKEVSKKVLNSSRKEVLEVLNDMKILSVWQDKTHLYYTGIKEENPSALIINAFPLVNITQTNNEALQTIHLREPINLGDNKDIKAIRHFSYKNENYLAVVMLVKEFEEYKLFARVLRFGVSTEGERQINFKAFKENYMDLNISENEEERDYSKMAVEIFMLKDDRENDGLNIIIHDLANVEETNDYFFRNFIIPANFESEEEDHFYVDSMATKITFKTQDVNRFDIVTSIRSSTTQRQFFLARKKSIYSFRYCCFEDREYIFTKEIDLNDFIQEEEDYDDSFYEIKKLIEINDFLVVMFALKNHLRLFIFKKGDFEYEKVFELAPLTNVCVGAIKVFLVKDVFFIIYHDIDLEAKNPLISNLLKIDINDNFSSSTVTNFMSTPLLEDYFMEIISVKGNKIDLFIAYNDDENPNVSKLLYREILI